MGGTFAEWILCEPLLYQGIPSVKGMKKQAGLEIEMSLELMEIAIVSKVSFGTPVYRSPTRL